MTLITYDIHNGYVATGLLFSSILTRLSLHYETLLYEWLAAKKTTHRDMSVACSNKTRRSKREKKNRVPQEFHQRDGPVKIS